MFKRFRILILLLILATVALASWRANTRLTAWEHTIHVGLYPIAADDASVTKRFIGALDQDSFSEISEWLNAESQRYGKTVMQPLSIRLAPPINGLPPLPPESGSALDAILWSLKFRWWASQHDTIAGPKPQIRLFVLFHDPQRTSALPHSTGLNKGQIGIIHAFASPEQKRQNAVVIAHELLHTFGASDKYTPGSGLPIFPQGYAEPERTPRWPQVRAEIMGGRIPLTEHQATIPDQLNDTVIGPETAREIGLLKKPQ